MKKHLKAVLLVALFMGTAVPAWSQASPSTEGRDFWVTFLRAADDDPTELKLTISAKEKCDVLIENPSTGYSLTQNVGANSSTELIMDRGNCYSSTSETVTQTALHVTSTKDISLFAGNYRDKSFDATNVLPTAALLDDYLIQTYPPSDHENKPQGSHFAIIAVEDNTVVDYVLTAKTTGGKTGAQATPTLKKGDVYYVWTGKNAGDEADLSGTTVKARNGKKIAVFQGCPHTNIPYTVRDRDHIISQAMPTAYWGSEFGITASRMHRRDIVAVMAINDGTEVYINSEDGEKMLVHTFDFSKDKKQYWTFEIGEESAFCADDEGQSPTHGKLPLPLVIDSSCYLTTSCPAGVHLFMVSNHYDNAVAKVKSDTLVSDPAMLWVSPIEQAIKEINFATYSTQQAKFHFMNIITLTSNIDNMLWNGNSIKQYFHPITGSDTYSFARIEIQAGNHNLKGTMGFLAHVYGYGQRESYAYSCGSSTVQRSISFNGEALMIDSVSPTDFCVYDPIDMKLNIGNNDFQSVIWDFGDGITYSPPIGLSNEEKKVATHMYTIPGWYDLQVAAVYINPCTHKEHTEDMHIRFRVIKPDTTYVYKHDCKEEGYTGELKNDTIFQQNVPECSNRVDTIVIWGINSGRKDTLKRRDTYYEPLNGQTYPLNPDDPSAYDVDIEINLTDKFGIKNAQDCDTFLHRHVHIMTCLHLDIKNDSAKQHVCPGNNYDIEYDYKRGTIGDATLLINNKVLELSPNSGVISLPVDNLKPGKYKATIKIADPNCEDTLRYPIDLAVYYPANIFKYKFNNVLAVYNPGYGGNKIDPNKPDGYPNNGYEFTSYKWYLNGELIDTIANPTAVTSIYHTEQAFNQDDEYYVVLTDKNGLSLPSCPQTITIVPDYNPQPNKAPAQKKMHNNNLIIVLDNKLYNVYGQRVQ